MSESLFPWPFEGRTEDAIRLEAYGTPEWAARAIFEYEIMTQNILDPCCGHGTLSKAAIDRGYFVAPFDIADWGYGIGGVDFLTAEIESTIFRAIQDGRYLFPVGDYTVLMNPPFSQASNFVKHAWDQGVRKIVCFQRWPWWESLGRSGFWTDYRPNRIYVCRERATCWRFDIPPEKRVGGTPTSHAWYVWERNQPPGTLVGHLDRVPPP